MAPMTRCRAIGNIPNDLMAKYYQQRATAGLIITEGTSPSPNGLGYARIFAFTALMFSCNQSSSKEVKDASFKIADSIGILTGRLVLRKDHILSKKFALLNGGSWYI